MKIEISQYPEGGYLARALVLKPDISPMPDVFIGVGISTNAAIGDLIRNPEFQAEIGIEIEFLGVEDRNLRDLI